MSNAAPSLARAIQFDARTDAVVYGDATRDFAREDWLRLALAALDMGTGPEDGRDAREATKILSAMLAADQEEA